MFWYENLIEKKRKVWFNLTLTNTFLSFIPLSEVVEYNVELHWHKSIFGKFGRKFQITAVFPPPDIVGYSNHKNVVHSLCLWPSRVRVSFPASSYDIFPTTDVRFPTPEPSLVRTTVVLEPEGGEVLALFYSKTTNSEDQTPQNNTVRIYSLYRVL